MQENGCKDIVITSNNEAFDGLGVERLEHENTYRYENGKLNGYWVDAFYPKFRKGTKVTFMFGDVYFSDDAIKQIVNYKGEDNVLFGSKGATIQNKVWGEPYAYVVNDIESFYNGIKAVKKMQDEGKTNRVPIVWELYRYLNGIDVNTHRVKAETYKVIDDYTDDADTPEKLERIRVKVEKQGNVFTVVNLNSIGGGESFLCYLVNKYKDRDITIYYTQGDIQQVERLKKYARVIRYTGQKIKCKRVFFNYNQAYKENIEADEYYQIIHADYYKRGLTPKNDDRVKFIAVSNTAAERFKMQTDKESIVCYNPIVNDRNRPIILMSATRLNDGKGKGRIERFAKMLEAEGVEFIWFVFTNDTKAISNDNIVFCKPRLDVVNFMFLADWFVQLSDDEAYCYSVVEALTQGVPCIVTPCPVFKELGLNSKNSITVDFDIKNLPIKKIAKGLPRVKYEAPSDIWDELLTDDKSTYIQPKSDGFVNVECIRLYDDVLTGERISIGTKMKVTEGRAKALIKAGVAKKI